MKRILLLTYLFLLCAGSVFSQQSTEHIHELTIAKDFLVSQGQDPEKCNLKFAYRLNTLKAFSDSENKLFAIVVSREYEKYLDNPILAYGIGSQLWRADNNESEANSIKHILQQYNNQLLFLAQHDIVYRTLRPSDYTPDLAGVAPLLDGISYGQGDPYNRHHPKDLNYLLDSVPCLVGCGPVCMAQILRYYSWPEKSDGIGLVSLRSGKKSYLDMSSFTFNWSWIKKHYDNYGQNHQEINEIDKLMLCAGASVSANMGTSGTSSCLSDFKSAFISNWKFSPLCKYLLDESDALMMSMLYREIDSKRPVIVAGTNHMFICDGYKYDFFHYNLGWNGYCDGYYRCLIISSDNNRQLPFNEMLIGIEPLTDDSYYQRDIKTENPGQLSEILTDIEKRKLRYLKISGPLNGGDIKLLRQMAGAVELGNYKEWTGMLTELDLRDADIVSGGSQYYTCTAEGHKIIVNGIIYDFGTMTPDEWDKISRNLAMPPNMVYFYKDGKFFVDYYSADNLIGTHMFSKCDNLRSLVLPKSIDNIGRYAFGECRSLRTLTITNNLNQIDQCAFFRTRMLENIELPDGFKLKVLNAYNILEESSPFYKEANLKKLMDNAKNIVY